VDEGMKKIACQLGQELARRHRVLILNPTRVFQGDFWARIKEFDPDVIHYIPGPSIKSFVVMRGISLVFPAARTVMSAPLPLISGLSGRFSRFFRPTVILAQSRKMEDTFARWGLVTRLLSISGVDTDRFNPAPKPVKAELRKVYGIGPEQFVVLHVGHVKSKRNVQLLGRLQEQAGVQAIVVGSTSTGVERGLRDDLAAAGCLVITKFVESVEQLYRLSDCYVFPTPGANRSASIEMPLSVLEAAACNLPIVSTRFGALAEVFDDVSGFVFAESSEQVLQAVERIRRDGVEMRTRERALAFSWQNVGRALDELYEVL
jgi:glycosyltransferase involved in cell wall biosynthesis